MQEGDIWINCAVEGLLDAAVAERLVLHVGGHVAATYGRHGKTHLLARLPGYCQASQYSPWLVMYDLDSGSCAPAEIGGHGSSRSRQMCLRIAVREVESWLLADRDMIARFLRVARGRIPADPDALPDPKQRLVNIARGSRKKAIREGIVPKPGSGRVVGRDYTVLLSEYVGDMATGWRPDVASRNSDSLARCLRCLESLVAAS